MTIFSCDDTATAATHISLVQSVGVTVRTWSTRSIHLYRTTSLLLLRDNIAKYKIPKNKKKIDTERTLLYLRISRTKLENASSTLMRCLAEVSIKRHPKCLARSRPSKINK